MILEVYGINISLLYVIIPLLIIFRVMNIYSKRIAPYLQSKSEENDVILTYLNNNQYKDSKDMFIKQRQVYANLFKLLIAAAGKYLFIFVLIAVISQFPFNITIPFELPLIFDFGTKWFTHSTTPITFMVSIIFYMLIYALSLNMYEHIIYYTNHYNKFRK